MCKSSSRTPSERSSNQSPPPGRTFPRSLGPSKSPPVTGTMLRAPCGIAPIFCSGAAMIRTVISGRDFMVISPSHFESFWSPAAKMSAAIDEQYLPRNRRRVGQIHDGVGDVPDSRRATHWRQTLHHVPRPVLGQRRVNSARRDGVHADTIFGVFHRKLLGNRFESALSEHRYGRVDAGHWVARKSCRDRDDASASLLRQHLFDGELGDVQESFKVRRYQRLEVVGGIVRKRPFEVDACVVGQY